MEDEESSIMKTMKGATTGFVAGTFWGMVVATWHDVPRVERSIALPGLIRTLKMMGNHGATFAAIGGIYMGVEQLTQKQRMKRDYINGAVGGFVAGATVFGFKGKLFFMFIFVHFVVPLSMSFLPFSCLKLKFCHLELRISWHA